MNPIEKNVCLAETPVQTDLIKHTCAVLFTLSCLSGAIIKIRGSYFSHIVKRVPHCIPQESIFK